MSKTFVVLPCGHIHAMSHQKGDRVIECGWRDENDKVCARRVIITARTIQRVVYDIRDETEQLRLMET